MSVIILRKDTGKYEFIIVGLGNPGKKYDFTRHNTGFMFIDRLCDSESCTVKKSRFDSLCGDAVLNGHSVLLMKPQTFMNLSGTAIEKAASYYKVAPSNVIVVCDDISLDTGVLRIRKKGSAGGHNGLRNIIDYLGTEEFLRVRVGVGAKPNPDYDLADWVLSRYKQDELEKLSDSYNRAVEAIKLICDGKTDLAMSKFNG